MSRQKAFTLVELLVVISIIALLVSILMPSLNKAKEIAYRMKCSTNQSAVGKAMGLYLARNGDSYPMSQSLAHETGYPIQWLQDWGGPNSTAVYTGFRRDQEPDDTGLRCITSLPWMVVREGNNPKIFVCPSDGDASAQGLR